MAYELPAPPEVMDLLETAAAQLRNRRPDIEKYDAYYRGEHKLRFVSDQFREFYATRYKGFADNWVQVVADAPTERLQVQGVRPRGDQSRSGDTDLFDIWLENEADAMSDMAWLDAIIAKRAFALVWGDSEGNPIITWEHPSQAIVLYEPGSRRRRAALKLWEDGSEEFATLYLPDAVYKFQRPALNRDRETPRGVYVPSGIEYGMWKRRMEAGDDVWPIPNPYGKVPMVEVVNRPRLLGEPMSDVAGTTAMQDAINLTWAYLFNTMDYASFPQRVVTGAERPVTPVLDTEGQVIGEEPVDLAEFAVNRITWIEDETAKIAQWDAAAMEPFIRIVEAQVGHIAAQTRTPQHYLIGKMANLSGDALKAAETGLVKRVEEKTATFGRAVREIFALCCEVREEYAKAADVRAGTILWRDVESRSEAQLVDSLQKMKDIGFPFQFLAERYGLSPNEVQRVLDMRKKELEEDPMAQLGRMMPGAETPEGPSEESQEQP